MIGSSSWRLVGFGERIDDWRDQEEPSARIVEAVIRWALTRMDDPYLGVRREPGFSNLWFGGITTTIDGDDIVTCSYWIEETDHVVRCDRFATLGMPL